MASPVKPTKRQPPQTVFTPDEIGLTGPGQHVPMIRRGPSDFKDYTTKLKIDILCDSQVEFTHEKCMEYINLPIFEGERQVADGHVQFLYDQIQAGTFNWHTVMLSTAKLGDAIYKINGQHTAWAVFMMPENFVPTVREICYKVANQEQLKLLYSTYDRSRERSDAHIMKVHLVNTQATQGVYANLVNSLASAAKFWYIEAPKDRQRIAPEQMVAIIEREFPSLFNQVGLYVQQHMNEPLAKRAPLLAAMFATFNKLPTRAPEFWDAVITGLKLVEKSDPRWQLRDFMQKSVIRGKMAAGQRLTTPEEIFRIAILCWNKWRAGEAVRGGLRTTKERNKPK